MPETLNVAVAGYAFMGRIHTSGWAQAAKFFGTPARVTHVIGRNRENTQAFADANIQLKDPANPSGPNGVASPLPDAVGRASQQVVQPEGGR